MTEPAMIAPLGELDLHTVRALTPQLDETVGTDYPQVILDLSALTLGDSTALGATVQAEHRFRGQGRTLSMVSPKGRATRCSSN
jgi:anti-anti-sigma factor